MNSTIGIGIGFGLTIIAAFTYDAFLHYKLKKQLDKIEKLCIDTRKNTRHGKRNRQSISN